MSLYVTSGSPEEITNPLYVLQSSGHSVAAYNPLFSLKEDHDEQACYLCCGKSWSHDSARTLPDGRVEDL